jgi:SAM-dependent methyltransferase
MCAPLGRATMPSPPTTLGAFAELVHADGAGPVGDLGCGPGRVTAYLRSLGLSAFGVDLSPAMFALVRRAYSDLRFDEGSITAVDAADGALGGIVAWYSIIRTPQRIGQQVFDEPALNRVVASYRGGLAAREAELAAVEAELAAWAGAPPLATTVAKLGAYRGIVQLTGLTLAAEVVDWRRFATARAFMGFSGLIPSEYSSGDRTRRGHITKAAPGGRADRADRGGVGLPAPAGNRGHPLAPPNRREPRDCTPNTRR